MSAKVKGSATVRAQWSSLPRAKESSTDRPWGYGDAVRDQVYQLENELAGE